MTKSAKIAFGVAAAAVLGLGAGAYHVHENVIPEQMAQHLNATLQDAYGNIEHSEKTHLSIDGGITVESDGFLTYKATTPMFLLQADLEGGNPDSEEDDFVLQIDGSPDEFQITFPDKWQAVRAAFSDTPQLEVDFKAIDGTGFGMDVTSALGAEAVMDLSVALGRLEGTVLINGDDYAVSAKSGSESIVYGRVLPNQTHVLTYYAELDAETAISFSNGNYNGADSLKLQNAEVDIYEVSDLRKSIERVTVDEVSIVSLYNGQSAEGRTLTSWEDMDLSLLPDDMNVFVALTGIRGDVQDNTFDVDVSYGASIIDLHSDNTALQFAASYELDGNILDQLPLPDKGQIEVNVADIPAERLEEITTAFVEDEDDDMEPLFALIGFQADLIAALEEAGAKVTSTVDLESSQSDYGIAAEFNHHVEGFGTPGTGFIRIDNFENAAQSLMMNMGPDAALPLMMLSQIAKPTEDGNGLIVEYDLDAQGGLKLNGQSMGPVFQP